MLETTVPKTAFLYWHEFGIVEAGNVSPGIAQDVTLVNLTVDLEGDFTDRKFTLTLTDESNPQRVFTSMQNDVNVSGRNVGVLSFDFEKFHITETDSYTIKLEIDDYTNAKFGVFMDWNPETNIDLSTQKIAPPRVHFYGTR